jgi:hypothetical protein
LSAPLRQHVEPAIDIRPAIVDHGTEAEIKKTQPDGRQVGLVALAE